MVAGTCIVLRRTATAHIGRSGGGVHATLFWLCYVLLGSIVPMALLWSSRAVLGAAVLGVLGAFAWLFVFIFGGQAFPLEIFPGYSASSSFADGAVAHYVPRLPEWLLGIAGLGAAFVLTLAGVRALDMMPHDEGAT